MFGYFSGNIILPIGVMKIGKILFPLVVMLGINSSLRRAELTRFAQDNGLICQLNLFKWYNIDIFMDVLSQNTQIKNSTKYYDENAQNYFDTTIGNKFSSAP